MGAKERESERETVRRGDQSDGERKKGENQGEIERQTEI